MPQPLTPEQVQNIRKGCQSKFDKALDSCLAEGILTTNQCLKDAAGEWASCMERNGITVKAKSAGGKRPKPKLPRAVKSRRKMAPRTR